MKHSPFYFLFIFFIFAFLSVSHANEQNKELLSIQALKSENGLPFWFIGDHSVPIISIKFAFRNAGTKNDPPEKQGLVRLLSNTMDEGAGDLDSQSFQKALNDDSISLYFQASRDSFFGTLKTLKENKEKAFKLTTMALATPRFDQEPLDRMRRSNIARIHLSKSEPDWILARLVNDVAFENEPYALNSGGTLSSLPRITPDDLRKHAKNFLTKDRLVIAVTGDLSIEEAKTMVDQIFGKLPETTPESAAEQKIKDFSLKNEGLNALYKKDIPQTFVQMNLPGITRDDPDYYPFLVMNQIFGSSGFGSRLTKEVREKRGLTYGIYSSLWRMDHVQLFTISASTQNQNAQSMIEIIRKEMEKMKTNPVEDKELEDAKSYLIGSFPLALSSTDKIADLLLSLQIDHLPIDFLNHRAQKIQAVTKEDITRVATRLFNQEQILTVLVGQPDGLTPDKIIKTLPNVE